jgi:hypothetical protein
VDLLSLIRQRRRYGGAVPGHTKPADEAVEGFVYVTDDDPGPMAAAVAGRRIAKASLEPPWIVVDHAMERVLVARWPGRLFRVRVVPARTEAERATMARAAEELQPDAGYTRALAVDVLEELPASSLFGRHGDAVAEVIDSGRVLTEPVARQLADARHPEARSAYRKAWKRWLSGQSDGSPHEHEDHSGTLAIAGAGQVGSPIGHGLLVVARVVWDRAHQLAGAAAGLLDEEGEEELVEPWSGAQDALLHAALAFGAPELADEPARAALTASWVAVFGPG